MSLPAVYQNGHWRGTIPFDPARQRLGVAFNMADGTTVRIAIDLDTVGALVHSMLEEVAKAEAA